MMTKFSDSSMRDVIDIVVRTYKPLGQGSPSKGRLLKAALYSLMLLSVVAIVLTHFSLGIIGVSVLLAGILWPPSFYGWERYKVMIATGDVITSALGFMVCTVNAIRICVWSLVIIPIAQLLPYLLILFLLKALLASPQHKEEPSSSPGIRELLSPSIASQDELIRRQGGRGYTQKYGRQ